MTLRTSLQRLIGRDPARLSLRERAVNTAARFAASRKAPDASIADLPSQAAPDAALTAAAAELQRLEATMAAIPTAQGQDLDDVPGYDVLDAEADRAADVLANTPADGLIGLQAKATAILADRFSIPSPEALEVAQSLARDIMAASSTTVAMRLRRQTESMAEPGSAEAMVAFHDACHEHTIRTQFANEYPELKRTLLEWWTADSLGKALETGELTPIECARLYPLATERELRMAEIEHELNLGSLHALAFAASYPVEADTPDPVEADPVVALIDAHHAAFCAWDTAATIAGDLPPSDPGLKEARQATTPLLQAEENAFMALVGSLPASLSGLMALADYLPSALALRGSHEADDEAALTVGGICASIRKLVAEGRMMAGTGTAPTDWRDPPPGFMASPTIEPVNFAWIPQGLRIELERLHGIARAEFQRRMAALHETGNDTPERAAAIGASLFLPALTATVAPNSAEAMALAALSPASGPDPIHAAVQAARKADRAVATYSESIKHRKPKDWIQKEAEFIAEQSRTRDAALATVPTTPGGRLLLLGYLDELIGQHGYANGELPEDDSEIWALAYRSASAALRASASDCAHDRLTTAMLDLWPIWAARPSDEGTAADVGAYEDLQRRRFALIDAGEALPATPQTIVPKALALAWLHYVSEWRSDQVRDDYTTDGRLALDIHAAATVQREQVLQPKDFYSIAESVDFASASMEELRALHELADRVGSFAYALAWTGRCQGHGPGGHFNAAGKLMQWLGDALTDVETAAGEEAARRAPSDSYDRGRSLAMRAVSIIDNDDPEIIEAFARELLAHAEAEREGR